MANVKLVFYGTERSKTDYHELVCYRNSNDEIFIDIDNCDDNLFCSAIHICLDKSTAIKLAKTLCTEINKMEDLGNG